jgi:hypothetical protein
LEHVLEKFDVILPAGGRLDDHFAKVALTPYKALIAVNDSMLGYRAIEAVAESGRLGRTVLVAGPEVNEKLSGRVTATIPDSGDLTKNIQNAIRKLKDMGGMTSRVLILTTDLPYINGKLLNDYLDLCNPASDLTAPVISQNSYSDRFPSSSCTYAKLKDGSWAVGCAYLINPDVFMRILPRVNQVVENRKNPLALAKLLGFGFLTKFLTKSLTVADVVAKIEEVVGAKIQAVQTAPAELAFDVDDIGDYEYALRNK